MLLLVIAGVPSTVEDSTYPDLVTMSTMSSATPSIGATPTTAATPARGGYPGVFILSLNGKVDAYVKGLGLIL